MNPDTDAKNNTTVKFLMRKEVTIVVLGSLLGAFVMHVPYVIYDLLGYSSYSTVLLAMARIAGSSDAWAGFLLHLFAATIIGIIAGVILYRAFRLDASRMKSGLLFGLLAGIVVFAVFAVPVAYILIGPSVAHVMVETDSTITFDEALADIRADFAQSMLHMLAVHTVWGLLLGWVSTQLTRRFGANYSCNICNIEFSDSSTLDMHIARIHGKDNDSPQGLKKILILGGGYGGVSVLNHLQKRFHDLVDVSIGLVSDSNFFLHTPMLPEMATGAIEARHIATPIRQFCYRAKFYQAHVTGIDLDAQKVTLKHTDHSEVRTLEYDYLVISFGMKPNFYNNKNIERNAISIRTLDDAIKIRDQVIGSLEEADMEEPGSEAMSRLTTFVVVGGGFSGVETVGELNSFVRDSVRKYYHNIPESMVRIILVSATAKILPEIGSLGKLAMSDLKKAGVTFHTDVLLADYDNNVATLSDGTTIQTKTLVWAAGLVVDDIISKLDTEHHKSGRIMVNSHLSLVDKPNVFALGDCAYITDPKSGMSYPTTAEHAMHEARIVANNLTNRVLGVKSQQDFMIDPKGSVAKIGSKDGVALMMGREMHGIVAWFLWKHYYLMRLPTTEKKIRIGLDWLVDLFFPRDITRLSHASGRQRGEIRHRSAENNAHGTGTKPD